MTADPYRYFRVEARDILDQLGKGLLELERGGASSDLVARLLRLAHTLKGAARIVKRGEIADLAHGMEDALAPLRDGGAMSGDRIGSVLRILDEIEGHVAALGSAQPSVAGAAATKASPEEPGRALRVDVAELDVLMDGVTEALVQVASLVRGLENLEEARQAADLLADHLASPRHQGLADGPAQRARVMAEDLRRRLTAAARNLSSSIEPIGRELRQARENGERMRLSPAGSMFHALERTARDAASSLGKRVVFETSGGEARLDAHVLATIQSALVQAVKNAVAHGIEEPSERERLGKSPAGRVALEGRRRGNRVVFRCRDDGSGVDLEAVRRAAERRGMMPAEAARLDADALLKIILEGGISTARAVTEVSGRGVGLDVVRDAAVLLGGDVSVRTEPHRGTTLEIVVPFSLTSVTAIRAVAAGQTAAIPLESVRRIVRVHPEDIARSAERDTLVFEGEAISYAPLARFLVAEGCWDPAAGVSGVPSELARSALIVEGRGGARAAFAVDHVIGAETILLQPLPMLVPADSVVAGASLDAEGSPQIVFDPESLVARVDAGLSEALPAPAAKRPILVIDDSMTTRMLEQSILESAGYDVDVAASGEEGLERARRRVYALFLVDVEMPGIDGFTFLERVRADPGLRDIPGILVTSRATAEDRARGEEAGANAYIVKSEFDQKALLDLIRGFTG